MILFKKLLRKKSDKKEIQLLNLKAKELVYHLEIFETSIKLLRKNPKPYKVSIISPSNQADIMNFVKSTDTILDLHMLVTKTSAPFVNNCRFTLPSTSLVIQNSMNMICANHAMILDSANKLDEAFRLLDIAHDEEDNKDDLSQHFRDLLDGHYITQISFETIYEICLIEIYNNIRIMLDAVKHESQRLPDEVLFEGYNKIEIPTENIVHKYLIKFINEPDGVVAIDNNTDSNKTSKGVNTNEQSE